MRLSPPAVLLPALLLGSVLAAASQPVPVLPVPALPAAPATPVTTPTVSPPASVSPAPATPVPVVPAPATPVPVTPAPTTPVPTTPPPAAPSGMRGLWIDGFGPGLRSPAEVAQMVSDAAGLGINTLFVQAVRRGDCLCRRDSVPPAADIQKGFDPLAEAVRLAHARGMRVIAWVSVTGAYNTTLPSAGPAQAFSQHGPDSRDSWLSRMPNGDWHSGADAWLDPGIPAAADDMAKAVFTLARNYDIDGVQLDRIRYPDGGDWGYSPVTVERYRRETGATGVPAPTDERWKAWKREQVTLLVRRIVLESRAFKPGLVVSAATIVYGDGPADLNAFHATRTYSEVLQDWPSWMKEGLLDANVIMNYKRDGVGGQESWFDHWNAFALSQRSPLGEVEAGTSLYLNTPEVAAAQAGRALALGMGWVGYAYRTPTNDVYKGLQTQAQGLAALKATLATVPGMMVPRMTAPGMTVPGKMLAEGNTPAPWTYAAPIRRAVLGRVVGAEQPGGLSVAAFGPGGAQLATATTDGNGYYGFTDLPAGRVEVRVGNQSWAETLAPGVTRFPNLLLRTLTRTGN